MMESTGVGGEGGGHNLGKMAKNCMKITKSAFFGQNSQGTWGCKPIFYVVGGTLQLANKWHPLTSSILVMFLPNIIWT